MWVKMKTTYVGALGMFPKDLKFDLPPKIIKQLPKGSYQRCKAPWDEHKAKAVKKAKTVNQSPKDKQLRPEKAGNYKTK